MHKFKWSRVVIAGIYGFILALLTGEFIETRAFFFIYPAYGVPWIVFEHMDTNGKVEASDWVLGFLAAPIATAFCMAPLALVASLFR